MQALFQQDQKNKCGYSLMEDACKGRGNVHLKIVLLDLHFKIKPSKLTQMSTCEGIFSTENRPNLKHTTKISTNAHLLV